jgi:hypothetical protein
MKTLFSAKPLLAAAVAVGALAAASAAHARSDVFFSIGIQAPIGYVQPALVYVQPRPVYVQPQPVYVQPRPVYVQPQPVYHGSHRGYERRAWGDADRDGVPNIHDRDSRLYEGRSAYRVRTSYDADRDGVPNRYDRAPNNRYLR